MKTELKVIALIGLGSICAFVLAQVQVGSPVSGAGKSSQTRMAAPAGGKVSFGSAVAVDVAGTVDGGGLNPAQSTLAVILIRDQQRILRKTNDPEARQQVILAHCTSQMWIRNQAQQTYEKDVTFQLDKFKPGAGPWDQVRHAPTRVNALLNLSADQIRKISKLEAAHYARVQKGFAANRRGDLSFSLIAAKEEHERQVYSVLSKAQKEEWDAILTSANQAMNRAAAPN